MEDEKLFQEFLTRLKIGIPGIESKGAGDYNAQNGQSTAAGKYQFTEYWLKSAGKDSIQSFVKNNPVFDEVKTLDDFKAQPELQDAYFNHYAENVLYPQAKLLLGKNPENFKLDEIGAIIHFQGYPKAKGQIDSGVLSDKTKAGENGSKYDNASGYKYLDVYNKTLGTYDVDNISNSFTTDDKDKDKVIKNFVKRDNEISALNLDPGPKEKLRRKLYQETYDKGNVDIVNEYINKSEKEKEQEYNQKLGDYNELKDFIEKVDIDFNLADSKNKTKQEFGNEAYFEGIRGGDYDQMDRLREKYDFFLNKKSGKTPGDRVIDLKKMLTSFEGLHKELTGEEISITPTEDGIGSIKKIGGVEGAFKNKLDIGKGLGRKGNLTLTGLKENNSFKPREEIDKTILDKKERVDVHEERRAKEKEDEEETTDKKTDDKTTDEISTNTAEEFFQRQLGLLSTSGDDFAYEPGKKELPVDAVMGMALGLIGNEQARNAKIPLRTEEVSEGLKNYAAELSRRSKEGLPVELEASLKNKLAEAYQGGLQNIVNASEGNSAAVLGNLGQLEQAKSKGLVAIQVADYQAKEKAFENYGSAMMEINKYEINRDIANHGILYTEGKMRQLEGKQLATAGFGKLMDAIKYDKENGPGSANDMYRSLLMQKMFGFDPKMKDDGTGDQIGTKSNFDKKKGLINQSKAEMEESYKRFQTLNPNQKVAMNKLMSETTDKDTVAKTMDFLQQNPEQDLSKFSMENLDIAIKQDNFGLLATDRKGFETTPVNELASPTPVTQEASPIPLMPTIPKLEDSIPQLQEGVFQQANNDATNKNVGLLDEYYNNK